jgi:signal peptidase I
VSPITSLKGGPLARAVQRGVVFLWVGLAPALLAGLVLRYFVPRIGMGFPGLIGNLGQHYGVYCAVALFFVFTALARYWRFWLPGGAYATALPAPLARSGLRGEALRELAQVAAVFELARSGFVRRRLERTLAAGALTELDTHLSELRSALVDGDIGRSRSARNAVEAAVAPAVAAKRGRDAAALMATVAIAVAIPLGLRARVADGYQVLSSSMVPTLEPGDRVVGNRLAYSPSAGKTPRRGDLVIFRSSAVKVAPQPGSIPEFLVKRVVGLPGDRIAMRGTIPIINGWEVPGCDAGMYTYVMPDGTGLIYGRLRVEFLDDSTFVTVQPLQVSEPRDEYVVEPGQVFVLGDNRSNSLDSRRYNGGRGGGVPFEAVVARGDRFLAGTNRSGETDLGRLFHPIDTMHVVTRFAGFDFASPDAAIARCTRERPEHTQPPSPATRSASR